MITKIIGKLRFYFAIFLLRLAVTINNAALAASVMAWVAWRAVPESPLPAGRTWPRVLCIGRTIFVDDVKAMAKYSGQIEYVVVHLQYFDQIFRHFFTQETRGLVGENNYHLSPPDLEGKVRYAEFLRRLLPHLRLKFGIQAVLSGNFNYSIQQELCRVSEYWGIPFIVLHKEGMDIFRDSIASLYGTQRFTGRKALFYNERIRKDFLQIKLPGLTEDNSVAVGIPRLDSYFVRRYEPPQKKQITLFTIDPSSYFTYLMNDKQKFAAIGERTGEYYRVVMEFALRHPEFRVVIKTKAAKAIYKAFSESANAQFGDYQFRQPFRSDPRFPGDHQLQFHDSHRGDAHRPAGHHFGFSRSNPRATVGLFWKPSGTGELREDIARSREFAAPSGKARPPRGG
ncbi:MAG: hypothetical protein UY73_C0001G0004 [Parcubacteria group bacterium GW2011_GWA2_52_8]|nr:MAG: hypothetical protein UY73_C0001G0004 [Parcubacteria group bacterium GW2011_GWA2_52_8]